MSYQQFLSITQKHIPLETQDKDKGHNCLQYSCQFSMKTILKVRKVFVYKLYMLDFVALTSHQFSLVTFAILLGAHHGNERWTVSKIKISHENECWLVDQIHAELNWLLFTPQLQFLLFFSTEQEDQDLFASMQSPPCLLSTQFAASCLVLERAQLLVVDNIIDFQYLHESRLKNFIPILELYSHNYFSSSCVATFLSSCA